MLALYILAGIFVFLVILMCIPVETTLTIDTKSNEKYSLIMSWLFGLVRRDIGKRRTKKPEKKQKPKKRDRFLKVQDIRVLLQVIDVSGLVKQGSKLLIRVFRQLKILGISGDFIVGLEDPAYTGMLFAAVGPVNALLNLHPRYRVSIEPFFYDEDILEGNLHGTVRMRPIQLIIPVVRFASSHEVRRMMKSYISKKWRKRRKEG